MVQNAGPFLKIEHIGNRKRSKTVAIYPLYSLYFR